MVSQPGLPYFAVRCSQGSRGSLSVAPSENHSFRQNNFGCIPCRSIAALSVNIFKSAFKISGTLTGCQQPGTKKAIRTWGHSHPLRVLLRSFIQRSRALQILRKPGSSGWENLVIFRWFACMSLTISFGLPIIDENLSTTLTR